MTDELTLYPKKKQESYPYIIIILTTDILFFYCRPRRLDKWRVKVN